jgi:non-heme chloroperoxidase
MTPWTSCRPLKVTTPDGVGISVQHWGNSAGPAIVFIHGMLQSHLSWSKQLDGPLASRFHLITYDFRGHGGSDKPLDASRYNDSGKFADELKAVMDATEVNRPLLVGWSFGTRIIADYLLKFGSSDLAGLNLVAPVTSPHSEHFGPGIKKLSKARDADFATSLSGTKEFLRACFLKEPTRDEFETMLYYNASVPVEIRRFFGRPVSDAEQLQVLLRSLAMPVLITHGIEDQVILPELSRWLKALVPTAELSLYQESGHAPFFEEPIRFNRELEAFAARAAQRG